MLAMTEKPEFEWLGDRGELDRWMDKHAPPPVGYEVLPDGVLRLPGPDGRPVDAKVGATIALAAAQVPGATKFVIIDDE